MVLIGEVAGYFFVLVDFEALEAFFYLFATEDFLILGIGEWIFFCFFIALLHM
jgi:hypothetical protein